MEDYPEFEGIGRDTFDLDNFSDMKAKYDPEQITSYEELKSGIESLIQQSGLETPSSV